MGQACFHRIPSLFAASFCSCALALLAISGITCDFVTIKAFDDHMLFIPNSSQLVYESSMGIICGNDIYRETLENDVMLMISRVCLFISIAMGSFTCVLAWAISSFVTPTDANWKLLSVFAAVCAILQLPIFLILESSPCSMGSHQKCVLADGSSYLICSSVFWLVVTVATQFLDPPRWADEINAWRSKPDRASGFNTEFQPLDGQLPVNSLVDLESQASQAPLLSEKNNNNTTGILSYFKDKASLKRWVDTAELAKNQTDSMSQGDEEDVTRTEDIIRDSEASMGESALCTVVDRTDPKDSSDMLGTVVKMAEEGKDPHYTSLAPPSRDASFAVEDEGEIASSNAENQLFLFDPEKQHHSVEYIYSNLEAGNPPSEVSLVAAATPSSTSQPPLILDDTKLGPQLQSKEKANKGPNVIKSLTESLKQRTRARKCENNKYALMDDDDMSSTIPIGEVVIPSSEDKDLLDAPGTPTKQAIFSHFDPHANTIQPSSKRASQCMEDYPDPIIASMGSYEDPSISDEEVPDPIISSNFSHELDGIDSFMDGSVSTGSWDSDDYILHRGRAKQFGRSRSHSRGVSSVRSVVSSTSLLDTFIAEETEADLEEQDETGPYQFIRSKSAPTQLPHDMNHQVYSSDLANLASFDSECFRASPLSLDDIQLAPITSHRIANRRMSDPSGPDSCSASVDAPPSISFGSECEDAPDEISFSFDKPMKRDGLDSADANYESEHKPDPHGEVADSFEALLQDSARLDSTPSPSGGDRIGDTSSGANAFTSRLLEWKEEHAQDNLPNKQSSPSSCLDLTAPETPSPVQPSHPLSLLTNVYERTSARDLSSSYESAQSFKDEREMRCGIHASPLELDDSSTDDKALLDRDRVRDARISRLKREHENIKKTRARTQDPPLRRRRLNQSTISVVDKLDLQLIDLMRPEGAEYGPDERSL